jgi:hypothetical protein
MQGIALVAATPTVSFDSIQRVAAALTVQLRQDVARFWAVDAFVQPFANIGLIPTATDFWPLFVTDHPDADTGSHLYGKGGNKIPYAAVEYSADGSWSIAASHECIEMLIDPTCGATHRAKHPFKQEDVDYLVEVCDPCESPEFAYPVLGQWVSDFYTPNYFDLSASPSVEYSCRGNIKAPRTVLKDGYIVWRDQATRHWYRMDGAAGGVTDLGLMPKGVTSIRAWTDSFVPGSRTLRMHSEFPKLTAQRLSRADKENLKNSKYWSKFEASIGARKILSPS